VDASGDSASQADESLPLDASEDVSQPDATGLDATASDAGPEGGGAAGFRAARELVMSHLADPDVFKVSDDLFLLTGTGTTTSFDIHASSDLQTFQLKTTYAPSSLPGSAYDYCWMWAPELWQGADGKYRIAFSAHRVAKGAACPPSNQDVTTFYAVADDLQLQFGPPQPFDNPVGTPRTTPQQGCPSDGCINAIRIDSAVWGVQDPWLFYVWFSAGNHVASFPLGAPSQVVHNFDPSASWEESINEAPDVFERDGKLYLFMSAGHFQSQYAMYYVSADSVQELTRARAVHRFSTALRTGNGGLLENSGHSAVTSRHGQYHVFYHVGVFDNGSLVARHTYRKPIFFNPDGTLKSLDGIRFRWSRLAGHEYSLDLKPVGKPWVGPCISVQHLGSSLSRSYQGICADGDVVLPKDQIEAARVYYSPSGSGVWSQYAEAAYDGFSDDLEIPIPGGETGLVTVRWNELQTGAQYSLDVKRKGQAWLAPCVGVDKLGSRLETDFDGTCLSGPGAGTSTPLSEVEQLRVCSAVNGDWAHAVCSTADYDGTSMLRWIALP